MASGGLLAALAMGPRVSVSDRFAEGQERGLKLEDILNEQEARQYIPGAVNEDPGALSKVLGLAPQYGFQILQNQQARQDRQADMTWRRDQATQSQKNADRGYQLDLQQFGAARADANWQRKYQEAQLALKDPDLVELYDEGSGQPYKARYNSQTRQYDRVGGIKAPGGNQFDVTLPDGTVIRQGAPKNLTEGQSKDVGYLARMADAVPIIDQMGDQLLNLGENIGGKLPGVGNYLKSPEYQQAEQAAGQWRQAFLRKDSGATITDQETADTNRLYIPQPGDKAPVLRQKSQARRTATRAVKMGIPYQAVMEMQKNGFDLDKILSAPLPGDGGQGAGNGGQSGKSDMSGNGRKTKSGVDWSAQ